MTLLLLDELYLTWLYRQVADPDIEDESVTYWKLLKYLFTQPFEWRVPNDDNRLSDGKNLRREFVEQEDPDGVLDDWLHLPCSVLELMVGLARRLEFEAGGEAHYWFWNLMGNIRLHRYSDRFNLPTHLIDKILKRIMLREYKASGQGGFFPLKHPDQDQRDVELWYQMAAYVGEQSE